MAQSASDRRRAQRALAESRRNRERNILPSALKGQARAARDKYGNDVIAGREPRPEPGTREAKNLARMASLASHGKADPRFEAAFSGYWYHKKSREIDNEADVEDNADYEGDEEDEDEE